MNIARFCGFNQILNVEIQFITRLDITQKLIVLFDSNSTLLWNRLHIPAFIASNFVIECFIFKAILFSAFEPVFSLFPLFHSYMEYRQFLLCNIIFLFSRLEPPYNSRINVCPLSFNQVGTIGIAPPLIGSVILHNLLLPT